MFTIEMDGEETAITILDTTAELEDVSVLMYDEYCHIRQWNEKTQMFDVVTMKPEMYLKMMEAWKLPEGAYVLEKTKQNEFENI
jgi:hypothetical protein